MQLSRLFCFSPCCGKLYLFIGEDHQAVVEDPGGDKGTRFFHDVSETLEAPPQGSPPDILVNLFAVSAEGGIIQAGF